jgi:AcrR family transcriptional regulator
VAAVDEGSPGRAESRRAGYRRSAGTPRGEARRRDLLDRVVDDLAVNGLVDFSLRRAARAAGTTHKVLLYYFDGADDLLQQAIWQLRERRIAKSLALANAAQRRSPIAFGWLTKRGDAVAARWMRPVLTQAGIRRDTVRVLRAVAANRGLLVTAAERLPEFKHPALVVWAREDRVMPPEHGAPAWPVCCPRGGWSRSRTATRSSRWTSPRGWPRSSGSSPRQRLNNGNENHSHVGYRGSRQIRLGRTQPCH